MTLDPRDAVIASTEKRLTRVREELRQSSDPNMKLVAGDLLQVILSLREVME